MQMNVSVDPDGPEERRERAEQRRREREQQRDSIRQARRDSIMAADTARARRIREAEECAKLYNVTVADSTSCGR